MNNNFELFLQSILFNAESPTLPNGVKKELTYQQAISIANRSDQLANESASHPSFNKYVDRQVEDCYRQREEQIRRMERQNY